MNKQEKRVNLSLQMVPINCTNSYDIIDAAIHSIQEAGVKYEVQPFATIMEGELEELWKVVLAAKEAAMDKGAGELLMNIQVHLKKDKDVAFEDKTSKFIAS